MVMLMNQRSGYDFEDPNLVDTLALKYYATVVAKEVGLGKE